MSLIEYHEENGSEVEHDGHEYHLNKLFDLTETIASIDTPVDQMEWCISPDDLNENDRIQAADITVPLMVTWWKDGNEGHRIVVLDGIHRLIKALEKDVEYLPVKFVSAENLQKARIH